MSKSNRMGRIQACIITFSQKSFTHEIYNNWIKNGLNLCLPLLIHSYDKIKSFFLIFPLFSLAFLEKYGNSGMIFPLV